MTKYCVGKLITDQRKHILSVGKMLISSCNL